MTLGNTFVAWVAGVQLELVVLQYKSLSARDRGDEWKQAGHSVLRTQQLCKSLRSSLVTWLFPSQLNWESTESKSSFFIIIIYFVSVCFQAGEIWFFLMSWEKGLQASPLEPSLEGSRKFSCLSLFFLALLLFLPISMQATTTNVQNFLIFCPSILLPSLYPSPSISFSATQSSSHLHADLVLILKPSSCLKYLHNCLKRSHRRRQGARKRKIRNSEFHTPMPLAFVFQKW